MNANSTLRPPHREWHGTHHSWSYRPHAFRWNGEHVIGINFLPLANDMHAWMLRRGPLSILPEANPLEAGAYYNPYASNGATLALIMARVINAYHDYATTEEPAHDATDVEIERLRLYNEILIYAARFCEVAIKQLLYCTQIPESRYRRMALGSLLDSPCPVCKKESGNEPHSVSLVGTLAHPFHLCLEFEHCAMDHMDLVNKLRNSQAAHSDVQSLNIRTSADSKAQLNKDGDDVLSGFLHMLSHLGKLEERMLEDLAKKGAAIELQKMDRLAAKDCNFRLIPGQPFLFDRQ